MLNLSLYSLFVITSIMTVATPGPGVLMTLMKSIGYGFRGAIWTICGTATGAIIMSAISATGVGLILRASPDAYALLRVVGAAYMIWLGIKNWRVRTMSLESALRGSKHRAIASGAPVEDEIRRFPFFMEGITLQMTNPMLIMFFVSLFPQFIDPKLSYGAQYGILAATYGILILAIHSGYSFVTSRFRGFLSSERMSRLIYRIGGSIFIVLALKVLWDVYVSLSAA